LKQKLGEEVGSDWFPTKSHIYKHFYVETFLSYRATTSKIHFQLLIFVMCSCPADEMEFEVTSDQRTGKPIACRVVRLEAGSVSFEVC